MDQHSTNKCLNCEAELKGEFCHQCGQKRIDPKEHRFIFFVRQFFGSVFYLENNFFKNLWVLAFKPGRLAADYIEGKRKRWMPPISVFLLINLVYFIFTPLSDLNLSLTDQLNQDHHRKMARSMVDKKLKEESISFDEYSKIYKDRTSKLSSSLVIVNVPAMAFLLSLIYFRKKMYFADHFIYSLYFFSFILLLILVLPGLLWVLVKIFGLSVQYLPPIGAVLGVIFLLYIFLSLKTVYKDKIWLTGIFTILSVVLFVVTQFAYRTFLFVVTIYST